MKSRLLGAGCVCLLASGIAASANAAPIRGSISLSAGFTPVNSILRPTKLANATGIDFARTATVDQGAGDFVLSVGDKAAMRDFQFRTSVPLKPLSVWAVDGFTFSMNTVEVEFQNNTSLVLSGTGTVSRNDFDDTEGSWEFSAQTADQTSFSWSSSSAAIVPVPAAVWLFSSGLLGLMTIARRRKTA